MKETGNASISFVAVSGLPDVEARQAVEDDDKEQRRNGADDEKPERRGAGRTVWREPVGAGETQRFRRRFYIPARRWRRSNWSSHRSQGVTTTRSTHAPYGAEGGHSGIAFPVDVSGRIPDTRAPPR